MSTSSIPESGEKKPVEDASKVVYEVGEIQSIEPVTSRASDAALKYAANGNVVLTKEMDTKLRWKADLYVLSFVSVLYGMQFADKLIPSGAAILGLTTDLFAESKTGYSWVGSSFYLGYLAFEFPMTYLLQKFSLSMFTGCIVVAWGIVLACTAACQTMESFLAMRTLLGALECVTQPALVILVSQWYKRSEMFSRTCCWLAGNGLGGIFVTSVCYGLRVRWEKDNNAFGMEPWRVIYIIMGCITIMIGVIFYFHVPDDPTKAWFLTEEEKVLQVERIRKNNQGFGSHHIKPRQIVQAFTDPRTWLYGMCYLLTNIPNGGITVFSTLILEGEGYTGKNALLMNLPGNAVEFGGMLIFAAFSAHFFRSRKLSFTIFGSSLTVMCLCLLAWGPNVSSRLAGFYLYFCVGPLLFVGLIGLVESDSLGHTKKLTTNAFMLVCYCAGNVIGPQTFLTSEAPVYETGKKVMAATQAAELFLACCLYVFNVWENRRRDKLGIFEPPADEDNVEFSDKTDTEMLWFRYSY